MSNSRDESIRESELAEELKGLLQVLQGESVTKQARESLKTYERVMDELCATPDGLVLRQERLVLPKTLRQRAVDLAHEGHMGMAKCKALLRTKLWFPEMDAMVEAPIKECPACLMVNKEEVREPVKSPVMREHPLQFHAVDYLVPPNRKVPM